MEIKNKVAIVTGSSGGIGLSIAKLLAKEGAKVVLAARNEERLKKIESEVPNTYAIKTDVRKLIDIKNLIKTTKDKFGRIDILVNNAGQGLRAKIENIKLEDYVSILELNVIGVLLAMQEVIPIMKLQGGGMILNVSSMVSKNYYPELGAYASTKYALNALSLTAREELKEDKVVVSVFHPKMTSTEFGKNARGISYSSNTAPGHMKVDTPEEVAKKIIEQIKSGDPEMQM